MGHLLGEKQTKFLITEILNQNFIILLLGSKNGKSPKSQKTPKAGKQKTTWDPFTFGGAGAKGQEADNLNYFNRNAEKNGTNNKESDTTNPTDHQLEQFVPDRNVIGKSSKLAGNVVLC